MSGGSRFALALFVALGLGVAIFSTRVAAHFGQARVELGRVKLSRVSEATAERLRGHTLRGFREDILVFRLNNETSKVDEVNHAIEDVRGIRRGAFLPLLEHPVVTAALIPFGGAGTVALLEVLRL